MNKVKIIISNVDYIDKEVQEWIDSQKFNIEIISATTSIATRGSYTTHVVTTLVYKELPIRL